MDELEPKDAVVVEATPVAETDPSTPATKPAATKKILGLGLGVATVIVLLGFGGAAAYGVQNTSENPLVVAGASILRLPVAKVNGEKILYRDYISDLHSLRTYYSTQPSTPFTPEEQSDQVLSRLIANRLVATAAKEMDISVSAEEEEKAKDDILSRFDNDESKFAEDVKKNLGLSVSDFYERVLKPTLLEQKFAEEFASSTDPKFASFTTEQARARHILFVVNDATEDAKVKAQAAKVLADIKKGADFAAKAKEFGTDGTKEVGGDLGWFGRGDMVKEFEDAAFALKDGELAATPVKSQFGYHLIKLEEKRTARDFSTYMNDKLRSASIEIVGNVHNPFANLPTAK